MGPMGQAGMLDRRPCSLLLLAGGGAWFAVPGRGRCCPPCVSFPFLSVPVPAGAGAASGHMPRSPGVRRVFSHGLASPAASGE
jgi:hypothetical protein